MWTFSCPTIVCGDDALAYLHQIPEKKVLVVTERAVVLSGLINGVARQLDAAGMQWQVFDQIGESSVIETVNKGGRMAGEYQPDWIIALGGQDCVKVASVIASQSASPAFESVDGPVRAVGHNFGKTKLMVIPAHVGSSSDAIVAPGEACDSGDLEMGGGAPDVAILAQELFQQLSPQAIALTGMASLYKAIDGYISPWGSSITDGPALVAVKQLLENIVNACEDAEDAEARMQLQQAIFLADLSSSHAMVGLTHGAARALAGIFHLPHGLAASLLLPYTMEFMIHSSIGATAKYAEIARFCGIAGSSALEWSSALVARVRGCAAQIGLPLSISQCIPDKVQFEAALPNLIDQTLKQAAVMMAVRVPDEECLTALFRRAYEGSPLYD